MSLVAPLGVALGLAAALTAGVNWMLPADLAVITIGVPLTVIDITSRHPPARPPGVADVSAPLPRSC